MKITSILLLSITTFFASCSKSYDNLKEGLYADIETAKGNMIVKLEFEKDALKELARLAIVRKTGARGLRSILEDIMLDIMFDLPKYKNKTITISKEVVLKTKEPKVA